MKSLASASLDKTVRIWDVRSSKPEKVVVKTKGSNINLSWNGDGTVVGVGKRPEIYYKGDKDDVITFYDPKNLKQIKRISFKMEVNEFVWDKTSNILFVTTNSGGILLLNGKKLSNTQLAKLECHTGSSYAIAVDPTGKFLATGAADALVCIWDIIEMAPLRTCTSLEWQLRQVSFSFDGNLLATASEDHKICLFNTHTSQNVYTIQCKAPQHTVSWHPNQFIIAYAGEEKGKGKEEDGSIHMARFSP